MELPFPNASALDIPTVHVQKHVVGNDGFLVDKSWPKIDPIQGICRGGGLRKAGHGWKNVHRWCRSQESDYPNRNLSRKTRFDPRSSPFPARHRHRFPIRICRETGTRRLKGYGEMCGRSTEKMANHPSAA